MVRDKAASYVRSGRFGSVCHRVRDLVIAHEPAHAPGLRKLLVDGFILADIRELEIERREPGVGPLQSVPLPIRLNEGILAHPFDAICGFQRITLEHLQKLGPQRDRLEGLCIGLVSLERILHGAQVGALNIQGRRLPTIRGGIGFREGQIMRNLVDGADRIDELNVRKERLSCRVFPFRKAQNEGSHRELEER